MRTRHTEHKLPPQCRINNPFPPDIFNITTCSKPMMNLPTPTETAGVFLLIAIKVLHFSCHINSHKYVKSPTQLAWTQIITKKCFYQNHKSSTIKKKRRRKTQTLINRNSKSIMKCQKRLLRLHLSAFQLQHTCLQSYLTS